MRDEPLRKDSRRAKRSNDTSTSRNSLPYASPDRESSARRSQGILRKTSTRARHLRMSHEGTSPGDLEACSGHASLIRLQSSIPVLRILLHFYQTARGLDGALLPVIALHAPCFSCSCSSHSLSFRPRSDSMTGRGVSLSAASLNDLVVVRSTSGTEPVAYAAA